MCRPLWFLVTAGLLLAADAPRDEAAQKDLERMQGDWAADSYVQDGMKVPPDDAPKPKYARPSVVPAICTQAERVSPCWTCAAASLRYIQPEELATSRP